MSFFLAASISGCACTASLLLLIAGAVTLLLVARLFVGYPADLASDSALSGRERALVATVADTFFAPGGPIPLSGCEAGAVDYFAAYIRRCPRHQQILIRLLILSTELGPLLFGPRPRRFTRLSQAQRTQFFEGAFTSRLYFRRLSFISFRAIMTMAYLANPQVAQCMNMRADRDPFGLENTS